MCPSHPPVTDHAVAQAQSGRLPQAQLAAAGTVNMPVARVPLPALSASNSRASCFAQDCRSDNKVPTTSKASAAATGARGVVAANGPFRTKANCRAGAVAANDTAKSKANCRAGSTASVGPIQTKMKKTARAAAANGNVNTKADSKAGTAATSTRRKPLPAEAGSALTTIQEGELNRIEGWC